MRISVIIPVYEGVVEAYACVNSLLRSAAETSRLEMLVQIDPSTEYLPPDLEIPARVAVNKRKLGFAGNCNAAAQRATGDILFFVNQDVYATQEYSRHWDAYLLDTFSSPSVGMVGPLLRFPNGKIQSAGGLFDAKRQPFHRFLGKDELELTQATTEVSWITGAALAVRAQLFGDGFDTAYVGGYFEDVDLCLRIRQESGCAIVCNSLWAFVHTVGSAGGSPTPLVHANARRFRERWGRSVVPDCSEIWSRFW